MKKSVFLLVGVAVYVIGLIFLPPPVTQRAHALNGYIDPNGEGTVGPWATNGANRFSVVDDATRQPTAPGTSDFISATASNGPSYLFLDMTTLSGAFVTTQITVWVYHNDGGNGLVSVQLYDENETTTRSSATNLTQSSTNAWHSVTFSGLNLTQTELDSISIRLGNGRQGGGQPATITIHEVYADVEYSSTPPPPPAYEQSAYRLFNSQNSTNVGTALSAQNSSAVLNSGGDAFRLRLLLHVTNTGIAANGQAFKLQYVSRGVGSCASPSGGTPASYTDVTTGTLMAYNNLTSGVNDGDAITSNANDPTHSSDTLRRQTVEESNNFTNSQSSLGTGEDGMWDFALRDNGAPGATTFCFRAVKSDGSLLDTYTQYPQITTGNGVLAVDIVDGAGTPVATPSFSMSPTGYLFTCDPSYATFGDASQRIDVSNFTGTAAWSVSIAATGGAGSLWTDGGVNSYDFNDSGGSPAGCGDNGDADGRPGRLSIDPSAATLTPRTGCSSTGVSLGSSSAFSEGITDSITLATASSLASLGCSWQLTNIPVVQQIPQDQANANYSINLTITATAL